MSQFCTNLLWTLNMNAKILWMLCEAAENMFVLRDSGVLFQECFGTCFLFPACATIDLITVIPVIHHFWFKHKLMFPHTVSSSDTFLWSIFCTFDWKKKRGLDFFAAYSVGLLFPFCPSKHTNKNAASTLQSGFDPNHWPPTRHMTNRHLLVICNCWIDINI